MGDVLKAGEVLVEEQRHDVVVNHDLGPDGAGPTSSKAMSINSSGESSADSCLYSECDYDEEAPPLDPKHMNMVHEELEKLNIATEVINKLEVQLDSARINFREIQGTWSERLKELSKKYNSAIQKARPYYEAKAQERKLRDESQRAAERFERATSLLGVAKQQVNLTQDSLSRQTAVPPECYEVLNHHTRRVSEAEQERKAAEEEHRTITEKMHELSETIKKMEKDNRASIKKSRNYFEQRLEFTRVLEKQKELILRLESEVRQKKSDYNTSLRNLERISDSIHEQRSIGAASLASDRGSHAQLSNLATGQTSAKNQSLTASSSSSRLEAPPANPPAYVPTAPPPYEDDGRYEIEKEEDPVLISIMSEDAEEWSKEHNRPRSLGSGVILLAQQLIGGAHHDKNAEPNPGSHPIVLAPSQTDVSYRTTLPEETVASSSNQTTPSDASEVSSLASVRTSGIGMTDDEAISGMLKSHTMLIQDIENATDRISSFLKRSVSDVDRESGNESSQSQSGRNEIC
ncbi:hypothetical protein WR25_03320 [Diploscapter pachys]|uniref:SH3 domain-binding protein 5-like n=1 Tax=Diploscapter pachys TaxID=2018661 RepID=A0A2A2L377_9BILA|nr:hypothetical protein WR25_03320 [Diploscapter pachys]